MTKGKENPPNGKHTNVSHYGEFCFIPFRMTDYSD